MSNQIVQIIKTPIERSNEPNFRLIRVIRGRGSNPTLYIYEINKSITHSHVGDVVYTINNSDINSLVDELSNMQFGGLKKRTKRTKRRKHKKSRKSHKKSKKSRR